MPPAGRPFVPYLVLAAALVGVSFGSIFVRLAAAPALAIALWRMTLASAVVVPTAAAFASRGGWGARRDRALAVAAGGLLALHFGTWITSLQFTTVAASVLLVNTAPVFVALLMAVTGQRPGRRTWLAVALGVTGAVVIAAPGAEEGGSLVGNLLAVGGAIAMAGYLMLAREAQRRLAYLPYVATTYSTAAFVLWVAVSWTATPWHGFGGATWLALGAMAGVSQLVGHGGYNWSLRHLHPAFVAVALTGEPVLASILAWGLLGESLTVRVGVGGAFILAAIAVAARPSRS